MPMKSYNPTTPSRRFMSVVSREEITKQTSGEVAGSRASSAPAGATARG